MKSKVVGLVGLSAMLWLLVLAYGCDKGVEPGGGAADYAVYFADTRSEWKYEYHPEINVLDSFSLPFPTNPAIEVSADGKKLYISGVDEIYECDARTKATHIFWPKLGTVVVSPDGELAAIFDGDFQIVRLRDLSVVFFDTAAVNMGDFSADSKVFYAGYSYVAGPILRVDFGHHMRTTRRAISESRCYSIQSSKNGRKLYLLSVESSAHVLFSYNWDTDSCEFRQEMLPGWGDLILSGDGTLFVSNPGLLIGHGGPEPEPPWAIVGLSTDTYDTAVVISTIVPYDGDTVLKHFPVGPMAITPDNKWIIGVCTGRGPVLSMNLAGHVVEHAFIIAYRNPSQPAVQCRR